MSYKKDLKFNTASRQKADYYSMSYIAMFGGLWGLIEILLGNMLHMFSIPLKGTILSALGCFICLTGGTYLPSKKHWPIFSMAIVAMVIRLFSFGIFKIHIFLSMFTAGLLMQIAVSVLGYNILGYILAGIVACLAPYLSGLLFFGIVFGQGWEFINHGLLKDSALLQHLIKFGKLTVMLLVILNILIGSITGVLAATFSKKIRAVTRG